MNNLFSILAIEARNAASNHRNRGEYSSAKHYELQADRLSAEADRLDNGNHQADINARMDNDIAEVEAEYQESCREGQRRNSFRDLSPSKSEQKYLHVRINHEEYGTFIACNEFLDTNLVMNTKGHDFQYCEIEEMNQFRKAKELGLVLCPKCVRFLRKGYSYKRNPIVSSQDMLDFSGDW